jgi:hypothetical protein
MTPADMIVTMLFHAISTAKKEDQQSLIVVLGIMGHVVEALPGDNGPLLGYIEQSILRYTHAKTL